MARVSKFAGHDKLAESPLTEELKQFIDRAIVPAIVKRYLAEGQSRALK
jgi:hypothetical protein